MALLTHTEDERRRLLNVLYAAEDFVEDLKSRLGDEPLKCPLIIQLNKEVNRYHGRGE